MASNKDRPTEGKSTETNSSQDDSSGEVNKKVSPSSTGQTRKTPRVVSTKQTGGNERSPSTHPTTSKANINDKGAAIIDQGKASKVVANIQKNIKSSLEQFSTHFMKSSVNNDLTEGKVTETNSSHEDQDGSDGKVDKNVSSSTVQSKNKTDKSFLPNKKGKGQKEKLEANKDTSTRLIAPPDYKNHFHEDIPVDQKKKRKKKGRFAVPSDAPPLLGKNIKKQHRLYKLRRQDRRRGGKRRKKGRKGSTSESTSTQTCWCRCCLM